MSTLSRDYEYGRIVSVDVVTLGDNLAADAAMSDATITVEDAADFDEDGGLLLLNGVVHTYTACDDDTGIISGLDPVLAAAAVEGDDVSVYDPLYATIATDKVAQVAVIGDDGSVDMLECAIALHLIDALDEGVRGGKGESVKLELDGGEWVVVDIRGLGDRDTFGSVLAMNETFTVAATGTQTFTVAELPQTDSEHVYWQPAGGAGIYQDADQWSRADKVLTVTDSAGILEVDDKFTVEYLRRVEFESPIARLLVLMDGTTWKYATGLGSSTTYAATAFDDSAWASGLSPMGFGPGSFGTILSPLDNVWERLHVSSMGGDLQFDGGHDDTAKVYIDGVQVYDGPSADTTVTFTAAGIAAGDHVIAVYGTDTGGSSMFVGWQITELG